MTLHRVPVYTASIEELVTGSTNSRCRGCSQTDSDGNEYDSEFVDIVGGSKTSEAQVTDHISWEVNVESGTVNRVNTTRDLVVDVFVSTALMTETQRCAVKEDHLEK